MSPASWPLLALGGVVALGFAGGPRWLRWIGIAATAAAAAGTTALAASLYRVGSDRGWTGDGPAMLVIGLLFVTAVPFALGLWAAVATQIRVARSGGPARGFPPVLALALIAAGLAGTAAERRNAAREAKPAHDAGVLALALSSDGARLVTIDAAGTLKAWRVAERRLDLVRHDAALAGAQHALLPGDGNTALVMLPHGVRVIPLHDAAASGTTLSGVAHVALLPRGEIALAEATAVRIVPLDSAETPRRVHSVSAPVSALAADASGWLVAALADGRLVALEGGDGEPRVLAELPAAAQRLGFSPGGRWLVAADGEGRAHVLDPRRGTLRTLDAWIGLARFAFVSDERLVFSSTPESPEGLALNLGELRTEPWLNHGRSIGGIAAAPGAPEGAVAMGSEVFLARAPLEGHAYAGQAVRLTDPR